MPLSTLEATMDHAEVRPTLEEGIEEAYKLFEELKEAGVDYDEVVEVLEKEGVQKFVDSYNELIEEIEHKSKRLARQDRKSTRLNSSHANISYAVFCLKKKQILCSPNINLPTSLYF